MCVFALKQYLKDYNNNNTNICVAFQDASKAFDKLNHNILFNRLKDNNVPSYIIHFLNYWYRNQFILSGVIIHQIASRFRMVSVKEEFFHLYYSIFIPIL